jgi:two-component system chemotaxis sensor kinase CheA
METQISKNKKNLPNMDVWEFGGFIRQFNLAHWLEKDLDILRTFLGDEFFSRKNAFAVDKQKLLEIERKMINTLSPKECSLLLPDIKRLRYQPFKELMKTYPEYVAKLAERMDKTIEPVVIEDDEALIDTEYYHDFAKSLVHVFRNSVDHGIETIEERVIAGKSEVGSIGCKITKQKEMLQIMIADDGRGIDLEAIRHEAVERVVFSQEESQNLSSEDLLHVIFRDEFSTKEEVTEISGRGVGLASVKAELDRVGGTVEIQTQEGRGTKFIFTLPLEQKNESVQVSISNIMDALIHTSKHFMQDQNMGIFELDEDISQTNRICLNNITALINIRGIVDAILVLSLNEQLAHRLVKSFVIEELTPEEEQGYIEDVVAEAFNIIAGNSIKQLKEIEDFITIGTPTIICYKGASIKYADSQIWSCVLGVEESEYSISLISMDKNLSEEGNIWHVF